MRVTVALAVYGLVVCGVTALIRLRRPRLDRVALCRLGDRRRWGHPVSSEDGADGLRYVATGAHAPRSVFQRQWVRSTNSEDDQIYIYFALSDDRLVEQFTTARRVVLGVEYFDLDHPSREGKGFHTEYNTAADPHTATAVERFSRSGRWRTAYFDLPGFAPARAMPAGANPFADVRILDSTPEDARQPFELRPQTNRDLMVRRVFLVAAPES